ncbi:hypothetical protein [Gymnodinialimonas hymeniacidonis]|uniref:hypothetical protein n=1 Tax=Gymnodinialimonas hymeniacidonis TaxID=3126508 RepID=UPI0034C5B9B2
MINTRITPALTLAFVCLAAPAMAEPQCSGGGYVADAVVVPATEIGNVTVATQYAWDGGGRLVDVCNLLTDSGFFATWSLFSGEVDAAYPGICVSLTNDAGEEWFSCQTPEATTAAFNATPGTEEAILRFEEWAAEAPQL